MNGPVWLILDTVYVIHTAQIAEHGGADGLRDEGLLLSALARPQNVFTYNDESDHASLAASYAFGIAKNHPFLDGNKRTALVVMRTFLALNDLNFVATPEAKFTTILQLAEGSLTEDDLAAWIRTCIS